VFFYIISGIAWIGDADADGVMGCGVWGEQSCRPPTAGNGQFYLAVPKKLLFLNKIT